MLSQNQNFANSTDERIHSRLDEVRGSAQSLWTTARCVCPLASSTNSGVQVPPAGRPTRWRRGLENHSNRCVGTMSRGSVRARGLSSSPSNSSELASEHLLNAVKRPPGVALLAPGLARNLRRFKDSSHCHLHTTSPQTIANRFPIRHQALNSDPTSCPWSLVDVADLLSSRANQRPSRAGRRGV